ncbi:hypothetical protein [Pseudobacteriovorax antillogorgiicola]|uniref:hypothetical protein n=1 Tax=Pseudobacteriovorax antillogorgiicola TaxID=1513793 RepID=UPI00104C71B9|nr:hypothetical protein [Pseudobacteriovorax antillogorgiicola]
MSTKFYKNLKNDWSLAMLRFGLSAIFLLISGCITENSQEMQALPPPQLQTWSYIPEEPDASSYHAEPITPQLAKKFPHLGHYIGHWLLANPSLHLVSSGVPPLKNSLKYQDLILESFLWSDQGWQVQSSLSKIRLRHHDPKKNWQLSGIQALTRDKHKALRYELSSEKDILIIILAVHDKLHIASLKTITNGTLSAPVFSFDNQFAESHAKENQLSFRDGFQSLDLIIPTAININKKPLSTELAFVDRGIQGTNTIPLVFNRSGRQALPFIHSRYNQCLPESPEQGFLDCLLIVPPDQVDLRIESSGDHTTIHLGNSPEASITSLPIVDQTRLIIPKTSSQPIFAGIDQEDLKPVKADGLTIRLQRIQPIPKSQDQATQQPETQAEIASAHWVDPQHGLAFRIFQSQPVDEFASQWQAFQSQNRGPAALLLPRFLRQYHPKARLRLECSDEGRNEFELLLLTRAAGIDEIDLRTCKSPVRRETFIRLWEQLHGISKDAHIRLLPAQDLKLILSQSESTPNSLAIERQSPFVIARLNWMSQATNDTEEFIVRVIDESAEVVYSNTVSGSKSSAENHVTAKFQPRRQSTWHRLEVLSRSGPSYKRVLTTPFLKI